MQTVFQLAIGLAPLMLASIVFLIGKKVKIMPIISMVICVAVLGTSGVLTLMDKSGKKKEADEVLVADYVYLAEKDMIGGDTTRAAGFLRELYAKNGASPEGVLANARLEVMRGDYTGAGLLYDKLKALGNEKLMSAVDNDLLKGIKDGTLMSAAEAASEAAKIKMLENAGADITEYGYTKAQADSIKKLAQGDNSSLKALVSAMEDDVAKTEKDNKAYKNSDEVLASADVINAMYAKYTAGESFDKKKLEQAKETLDEAYSKNRALFAVNSIDEAYVKSKIMGGENKKLATYADETDSQLALTTVSQLIIDGDIKEKDMPENFVSISSDEQKKVLAQCKEAMTKIEKEEELEGAELRKVQTKLDAVEAMSKNPLLSEMVERVDAGSVDYSVESPLHLGNSALFYALGNTDMGDSEFGKSLETAPYYKDKEYSDAFKQVSSVINDVADINEVKNVGQSISDAYDIGVPHVNPVQKAIEESAAKEAAQKAKDENDADEDNGSDKDDKAEKEEEKPSAKDGLTAQGTTYVSKKKAVTNIGNIVTDDFPKISFNLQTAEPLDLEKNPGLIINDCGINITDYTIVKNEYNKAKIYAVCDKSGSMEGSDGSLRAAVRSLASSISKNEQIGVIGFSSSVEFQSGMKDSVSELDSYIERLKANGGTNIAAGTFAALDELAGSKDSINVVIVMTDGEDSSFNGSNLERLRNICSDGHTIVYTLGLGSSVNADYLRTIANAGNGKFVYSFSASELAALYSFIHAQMENNYTITFTAKDLKKQDRTLTVTNVNDGSVTSKDYHVDIEGEEEEEETEIEIDGFATKKLYAKNTSVKATITGKNFKKDMSCYVSITSDSFKGSYEGKYVSGKKFTVTFPKDVPPGKYQAKISIGEASADDEIEIIGDLDSVTFGAYTFTAEKIVLEEDTENNIKHYTLNGSITMNSFLHFNGTLLLDGNFDEDTITMTDNGGSYITFDKPQTALFGYIVNDSQKFDAVGEYKLHKDEAHMTKLNDYEVESVLIKGFKLPAISTLGSEMSIYPHMVKIKYAEITLSLPMQSQFLSLAGIDFGTSVEGGYEAIIDSTGSYSKGKANLKNDDGLTNFAVKEINAFAWNPTEINLEFDTFKHDYAFTLKGKLSWMSKKFALVDNELKTIASKGSRGDGFSFAVKEGCLDEFVIYFDHEKIIMTEVGPITFDNFFLGVSNMKEAWEKSKKSQKWSDLLYAEAMGGCNISMEKISSMLGGDANPIVKKLFGDLSLLTLDSLTLKGAIKNFHLTANADVKLFGEFDFGSIGFAVGNYKYEDYYIGMSERDVFGIQISVSEGPSIDLSNFKIKWQGTVNLAINNVLSSLRIVGDIQYDITIFQDYWNWKDGIVGTYEIAFKPVNGKPRLILVMHGDRTDDDKAGIRFVFGNSWLPTKEYF